MTSINAANCWQCYDRVQDQNIWSPGYQCWSKNFVWWHILYSAFWALTISPSHLWDRGTTSTEVTIKFDFISSYYTWSVDIYNSTRGSNKTWMSTGVHSHSKASENTDSLFTENLNIFLAARYPNNFQSPQMTVSLWNCSHYTMQYSDH